jgi:hypothetical protein
VTLSSRCCTFNIQKGSKMSALHAGYVWLAGEAFSAALPVEDESAEQSCNGQAQIRVAVSDVQQAERWAAVLFQLQRLLADVSMHEHVAEDMLRALQAVVKDASGSVSHVAAIVRVLHQLLSGSAGGQAQIGCIKQVLTDTGT